MSSRAVHIVIAGQVQNVGYRVLVAREAGRLHLHGFVRNRSDGSVETFVQGPAEKVEEFISFAAQGSKKTVIQSCRIEDANAEILAEFAVLAADLGADGFFAAPALQNTG